MGEALVDLIATDGDGRTWRAVPGGAPYNAAIAAGRLGAPTTYLGVLSEDRFGGMLRHHLAASNVDHSHCPATPEPTTLALVGQDDGEFTFHVAGTTTTSSRVNDLHLPSDVGLLHVSGSVAMVLEPVASRLEGLLAAAQHRALIHVDANPRPQIIGRDRYLRRFNHWLALADVLKVSAEDIEWMSPGADALETAKLWVTPNGEDDEHRPGAIVLTRGSRGASIVRDGQVIDVAAPTVEVVDTVGAGDTFAGAILAALAAHHIASRDALDRLDGHWWRTAATYAAKAAAISCTRAGADPPRRSDLSD